MTAAQIITKFELYLDDTTELSTQEELDLLNKVYRFWNSAHTWEGTKSEFSDTTSTSVSYVALPSDFLYLTANNDYTDSSYEAGRPVVFRSANYSPYPVVSWSDRRKYRNSEGYAYIDFPNSRLEFTKQPTVVEAVEFDYHAQQADLTSGDTPWFPVEYHDALFHFMAADDFIIQQSPKAKSYREENLNSAVDILNNAKYWNSQLVQI
jgi:hypothetical protein